MRVERRNVFPRSYRSIYLEVMSFSAEDNSSKEKVTGKSVSFLHLLQPCEEWNKWEELEVRVGDTQLLACSSQCTISVQHSGGATHGTHRKDELFDTLNTLPKGKSFLYCLREQHSLTETLTKPHLWTKQSIPACWFTCAMSSPVLKWNATPSWTTALARILINNEVLAAKVTNQHPPRSQS